MFYVVSLIFLILTIVVHEAGHAYFMRKRGVEIKDMGIGLPVWKLKLTLRPRWLPFPLVLSPILLGAYVNPTDEGQETLEALSFDNQAAIYGAGVLMNILFTSVSLMILSVVRIVDPAYDQQALLTLLACVSGVTALLMIFRKWFFRLVPFIGVLAAALIMYALVSSPEGTGGPVEVARQVADSKGFVDAVLFGANISLGLALFNMVPIMPLDGGRTALAIIERTRLAKFNDAYTRLGTLILLGLICYIFISDFL